VNGWITQRRGTYYAVIDHGTDRLTGKRQRKWHKAGTRKRAAQQLLSELLETHDTNTQLEPEQITVGSYLTKEWLPSVRSELRFSTFDSYRRNIEIHVVPRLGDARLQTLRPIDLTRYYKGLLVDGRRDGRGGLAPKSVRNIHITLRRAFDDAVDLLYLRTNPATAAKPPTSAAADPEAIRYWTSLELRRFLDVNMDHRHWPIWDLAANTGMRRGELVGLRWRQVDLDGAVLSVNNAIISVGYAVVRSDPKTRRGHRMIDLNSRTIAMLEEHRRNQDTERRTLGLAGTSEFVFTKRDGTSPHPEHVRQAFDRRVARTDVPRIRFHDLRHTHATLMLMAGVPPKVVSERLGHATVAFTMEIYAHVIPGMQADAANLFEDLVFGEEDE
jgi:integrase